MTKKGEVEKSCREIAGDSTIKKIAIAAVIITAAVCFLHFRKDTETEVTAEEKAVAAVQTTINAGVGGIKVTFNEGNKNNDSYYKYENVSNEKTSVHYTCLSHGYEEVENDQKISESECLALAKSESNANPGSIIRAEESASLKEYIAEKEQQKETAESQNKDSDSEKNEQQTETADNQEEEPAYETNYQQTETAEDQNEDSDSEIKLEETLSIREKDLPEKWFLRMPYYVCGFFFVKRPETEE